MGGRGSNSAGKHGTMSGVPRINNPVGIPSNAITEDEFLMLRGVGDISSGFSVDKLRGNRDLKTQRGENKFLKSVEKAEAEYQLKRQAARTEYAALIKSGVIRDKTSIEKALTAAHGHSDNQSTQAARRILVRRGIDWQTGEKLP